MKTRTQLFGWPVLTMAVALFGAGGSQGPSLKTMVEQLGNRLEQVLESATGEEVVIAIALEADSSISDKQGHLIQKLERLLVERVGKMSAVTRVASSAGSDAESIERVRRSGATLLLHCQVGLEQNTINVTAKMSSLRVPFWDRLATPVPKGSGQQLFVSAPVDEEIELLLGRPVLRPSLGNWHFQEILRVPGRVLDLGLGEINGEPGAELVLLYEEAIEIYLLEEGRPRRLAVYSLESLPEEKIRVRDPRGNLLVVDFNADGRCEIFHKLFNRRRGEVLVWTGSGLRSLRNLDRVPLCVYRRERRPIVVYGTPETGTNRFLSELDMTDINQSTGERRSLPDSFVALRCWQDANGGEPWILTVDSRGGISRVETAGKVQPVLSGVGAGFGVVDLDLDGQPEVIASDPVWPGEQDSVRVFSGATVAWQSRDVQGGIVAVAGGDLAGQGKFEAVLAAVDPAGASTRIYLLGR